MNDKSKQTTRILHRPKVTTDELGHTVWADPVETAKLELMSTQTLKQLIEADDANTNDQLREAAEGKDGLLVHDIDHDRFEIISDEELQNILDGTDLETEAKHAIELIEAQLTEIVTDKDELDLVSTQKLRALLSPQDEEQTAAEGSDESGFDPYNRG